MPLRSAISCIVAATLFGAAAEPVHLVFPAPGHPEYTQNLIFRTYDLKQRERQTIEYTYSARCLGISPETPASNSNFGMNMRIRYMDGSEKWFDPGTESPDGFRISAGGVVPSPREAGWQKLSGQFVPPRAISNVTVYCRIARAGEAWFDGISVRELPPAVRHRPCSLKRLQGGLIRLENEFVEATVDPSHGGAAVRLVTKKDGKEHAARCGGLFHDAFSGCGTNRARAYEVVRTRNTPSSAEVALRTTGVAGLPFLEIEKTFRLARDREGIEVERVYRNLPAAMSDVSIEPEENGAAERIDIPLGGTIRRRRIHFGDDAAGVSGGEAAARQPRPFRLELSEEVVSEHTPWLKPYAGGTTRALFILDIRQQREIVELSQRMDVDARTIRIAQVQENMSWGMIDRYGAYNYSDANKALAEELDGTSFDVVVIAGRLWERLDEGNRKRLLALLEGGTGLVAVENPSIIPSGYAPEPEGARYVKNGIPEILLPFGADRVRTFAKGRSRAVLLEYRAFDGLTPFVRYDAQEPGFRYADYTLGMVAKCLLWAARKEMPVPAGADVDESAEDAGDGTLIRRRIFSGKGGKYGFMCMVEKGVPSPAAAARFAERERRLAYPSRALDWPDFPFSIGECCHRNGIKRYLLPLRYAQLMRLGVNQIRFWAVDPPEQFRPYLEFGLGMDFPVSSGGQLAWNRFWKEFSGPFGKTGDRRYLCRKPCLNDAAFLNGEWAKIGETVRRLAPLRPVSFDCGDENSLTRWSTQFDFCFSEHCLTAFRKWLRTEYQDLDALNFAWGTRFPAWDAVMPDTTVEAKKRAAGTGSKAYGAWADHRRFMEITYANYFAGVRRAVEAAAPDARFDMSGTQPPNGWTGMDMWLIGKVVNLPALYDVEDLGEIIRSFGRPFAHPWYGYRLNGPQIRWRVWNDAFRFLDFGISFYHEGLMLMPDYTVPEQVAMLADAILDLRAGGARLLRSLEGEDEALIHYSQASIHAAQIEDRYQDFLAARSSWIRRLVAAGVQFRFASYEELENGLLDRSSARFVILPHSAALSAGEVEALRRFAARGGTVVGDVHTGRMDQHCRTLERNPLEGTMKRDADFGEERHDGIRVFRLHSRLGLPGTFFGFTRELTSAPGVASRRIRLPAPAFVHDLRKKTMHGPVSEFAVELAPGDAAFYAALPYRVDAISAGKDFSIAIKTSPVACGLHPVKVELFTPDGRPAGSCMAEVVGGKGSWKDRVPQKVKPGRYQAVFVDFISGKTCTEHLEL